MKFHFQVYHPSEVFHHFLGVEGTEFLGFSEPDTFILSIGGRSAPIVFLLRDSGICLLYRVLISVKLFLICILYF